MESQKRETSPRPALVNNSVFSTPSSLRQSPRDRSRSPQRTVHYDCEEKAMEESPVNRSLMNPHYRPLSASRTPTSTESRMTIHEFDHTMSNWSLAPSGMISAPLGRTSFRTPPLQVPRRFTSNTIESRRMVAPWTKAPPRPPMPKRAGSHDVDRLQSTTTTNRRSEMVYRPTEPARNQTIYEEQHLHKLNHNEPSEDTIKEQEIEDSLNTTVASNGGSPFDPRRGDDSGLTELERVWARKRMTKIRTVRQTILPEKHKSEHNNHLPVRDYDSPAELTTTGSEESKMRDHVETNGNDGFQNISRKSSSPLAILDLQNMSKLQTLKLTESSIQESNQRNTPSKGSTEFRKVSIEMSQTGAQEQETPPNIVPCQYSASIRPVVTGLRNEHMDHHGSLEKLQRPPISSTKSENVGCEIKGLMIKAVISHEETTVSTENITQTKEAISKDKTDIKQPTDRYSRSLEQRNFLSQEVSLKPTGETSKEPNSNIVAVSTEKMMTLTTHLQTAPDSRAVSMSKLTIALPDIQRPNSTAFNMNEIKIPRPMTTTAVTAPTSTTTTTGTTTTPTPVLMNPGTGRLSALTPMATIVESTTRTTTTTTASKTIKRSPPELMEKPKLHLSNGAIPNQTHVTDLQLIKPQPRPELSYSDGKMNLAVTDRLSASAGGNKVQTVWSSSQTKEPVFETMQRPPYPTLFDILHHCNILRVVLDPNIPSQSKQLGLHLGLSKFPLDDIQRASSIQRLQQQQQQSANTGSKDTLNSVGSESQYGPKGPKPRIRPREGSAFRAVEYRRLEDAPDIVTIERVDPDSPAAIEGGLTAGTLLLEINGKTLLPTADSDDLSTSSIGLLRLAVEQLQAASQAGRLGEAALVRITAARYHNRFGVENKVDTPERISLANRRFIIGKAMNDTELEDQILSWRKTPSSIISSDAASLRSSRRKSDVSLGRTSLASQSEAGTCTPINGSQSEPNSDTSRAQSVDAVGPKDGLVWFPASRVTFKPSPLTMERSTRMMRNAEAWS
ncbi:unnamed protein product [Echinostoma caproni]|uniref:PDZ domain-containing protein n=1 Tax=Echinostoma caproni TaxID=27848 RepID=A0A183A554_9TREM|nr:unnamed protein product [Echinostoma caproni]